jgi:DNA-binding NarL/FixJ family response regulator
MPEPEQRILLVEDDAIVRSWVGHALEGSEFLIVATAGTAAEAEILLERRRPALLLMDYRLPDRVGSELLRDLRRRGVSTPAVLMTANPEPGFNDLAREAGAQGTVLKTGSLDELLQTLRAVAGGEESFDARHPRRDPGRAALSPRERQILRLVAAGATNLQIAEELGIGGETVKTLLARTFAKLGARRRAEAVSAAHDLGLL